MLSRIGAPPRSVLVTSALTGEGKSFVSWNLAILFAQQGKRVLLCDANLRHPWLHRNLEVNPQVGLSTVLAGLSSDHGASVVIPVLEVPGLFLIPSGPLPPYPAEMLASRHMADLVKAWEAKYDLVILDAPPVLEFTDPVVLSSIVNSVLLMARHQKTPLSALEKSYRMLDEGAVEQRPKDQHCDQWSQRPLCPGLCLFPGKTGCEGLMNKLRPWVPLLLVLFTL